MNSSSACECLESAVNFSESCNPSTAGEQWEDILAAAIMGVLSIVGLVLYTVIVAIIIRYRKQFLNNSYYVFVLSLSFSDSLMLVLFALYSVPCTILQVYIFGDSFDRAMGVICVLQYITGCVTVALIALNRYWAICRFENYPTLFNPQNVYRFMIGAWVFGIIASSFHIFSPFGQDYYYDGYGWGFDTSRWGNKYYTIFDQMFSVVIFLILVGCYAKILIKRPGQQMGSHLSTSEQKRRATRERSLALQFGFVVIILIVQGLGFTIVPYLTSNKWAFLALSVLFIVNNSSPPFIYLIFNSQIRGCFFEMMPYLKLKSSTVASSMIASSNTNVRRLTLAA